ncbi:hypothetical protein HPB50_023347 [Hyalomma asiaticum]|uniref:Uncharacterized protein n=1 Tax=Hyalomma asiaticum TaxID=266040 RepID=A0ACB7TMS2_HYAAI|nr:hypothetical protein HPB50_023347 [Hyalomma asiaticum]
MWLSVFLSHFESSTALSAWAEQYKAPVLVTQLRSPAAEFLEHLLESDCTDYNSLVTALESRIGDSYLRLLHLTELQHVRQDKYSLPELAAHVEHFSWKALAGCPSSTAGGFSTTQAFRDAIMQ